MLLNAGSSFWVNHSVTTRGGLATLLPTRGSAGSRNACACAAPVASTSKSGAIPIRDERRMGQLPRKGGLRVGQRGQRSVFQFHEDRYRRDRNEVGRSPRHWSRFVG